MKKISVIFAAALAVLAVSCQKNEELPEGGPATFSVIAPGETNFPKLAKNGTQVIYFAAGTEDIGVKGPLTATFKVGDDSLVDQYNAGVSEEMKAKMLPHDAFSFLNNTAVIDRYNRTSHAGKINVTNGATLEGECWYVLPIQLESVEGSPKASFDPDGVVFFSFYALSLDKGKGTKNAPYLIYEAEDLLKVENQCLPVEAGTVEAYAAAEPTYFKLMADIDMAGQSWTPLNASSPYSKKIDFNGNHHSISNLSYEGSTYGGMFGVLCGEVYDLNLLNETIKTNKDKSGLLAGYLGTGNVITAYVHGCKVQGTLTVDNNTIGGIGGCMVGGEIYECEVDADIVQVGKGRYYAGGIVGCGNKRANLIHDCITKGSIVSAGTTDDDSFSRNAAGIAGAFEIQGSEIRNCISLAKVETNAVAGGIAGHCNANSWGKQENVNNKIIGCLAWNESILVTNSRTVSAKKSRDDYAMGGGCIMGWGNPENTLMNCYRKSDINFKVTCPTDPASEAHFKPFDQGNAGPGTPLEGINCNYSEYWEMMYHGKATTKTASEIAKEIGWDETVWDLSKDVPSLKNVY